MRAMIVAAGLGTRLRPLTDWRPKPAVPVRGLPLIAYPLAWLAAAGVREVVINVHHHPEQLRAEAERFRPPGLRLHFSHERSLLHTGGAIRRVASFLRESDPSLILGGDMVADTDLRGLVKRHVDGGREVTLLLKRDPRAARFGTIGVDAEGRVCRIPRALDRGGERDAGLYTWVNVVSARALDTLPERDVFNHLTEWLAPRLQEGATGIVGEVLGPDEGVWEPVGTLEEYLEANLAERSLSYLEVEERARALGTRFGPDWVLGAGAELGAGARLHRAVVWDGERVPAGFRATDGVYAGGTFHRCARGPEDGAR